MKKEKELTFEGHNYNFLSIVSAPDFELTQSMNKDAGIYYDDIGVLHGDSPSPLLKAAALCSIVQAVLRADDVVGEVPWDMLAKGRASSRAATSAPGSVGVTVIELPVASLVRPGLR